MIKEGMELPFFIDKRFNFRLVEKMTLIIKDVIEYIIIEIYLERNKSILISCIYRPPCPNIIPYVEIVQELFTVNKQERHEIKCGDCIINLLNLQNEKEINNFIEIMYDKGYHPLITKPSKFSRKSSTIIDNIFYNNLKETVNGLIVSDVSDDLPVFAAFDCEKKTDV